MSTLSMVRAADGSARPSPDSFFAAHGGAWQTPRYAIRPRKPGLFVIGAMKSGTTYLNKLLGAHPDIFMCSPEEPSYFVDPRRLRVLWPEAWHQGFWRSEERYLNLFRASGDASFLGELSTSYTKRPVVDGIPERIQAFNPGARFIYVMRDPIERTISHYWHMVRFHAERRPILEAIRNDPQYLDVSHYAMQLTPYLDQFGPDSVAILTSEELADAPVATMRPLYEWLGVDARAADASCFASPENVTPEVVRMATRLGGLQQLRQQRAVRHVVPWLPRPVRKWAVRQATLEVRRSAVDASAVIRFLRPIQLRQTDALARLVGRTFPEWATLYGGSEQSPLVSREMSHEG